MLKQISLVFQLRTLLLSGCGANSNTGRSSPIAIKSTTPPININISGSNIFTISSKLREVRLFEVLGDINQQFVAYISSMVIHFLNDVGGEKAALQWITISTSVTLA